jgi:hypothetical protein
LLIVTVDDPSLESKPVHTEVLAQTAMAEFSCTHGDPSSRGGTCAVARSSLFLK